MALWEERARAVALRKQGLSYNEILQQVSVAKSTLSLWLRDVGLARHQKQALTEKRRAAQKLAAEACREKRLRKVHAINEQSKIDVGILTRRELWLFGVALYWAEGDKERARNSAVAGFSNTDPKMIRFFVRWLQEAMHISKEDIYAQLYIHQYQKENVEKAIRFWIEESRLSRDAISATYFKRHNPKTKRTNAGEGYYGTLRVRIRRSSSLVRKINAWAERVSEQDWGIV